MQSSKKKKPLGKLVCEIVRGPDAFGTHPLYRITSEDKTFEFYGRSFSMKKFIEEFAENWGIDPNSISVDQDELLWDFSWKLLAYGVQEKIDEEGSPYFDPELSALTIEGYINYPTVDAYRQEFGQEEEILSLLAKFDAEVSRMIAIVDAAWEGRLTVRSLFDNEATREIALYAIIDCGEEYLWNELNYKDFGFEVCPEVPIQSSRLADLIQEATEVCRRIFRERGFKRING